MTTSVKCPVCGFPVLAPAPGDVVNCPECLSALEGISGVDIPTPLFAGMIGFGIGVILGPAFLAATRSGATRLEQMAQQKLRGAS